MTVLRSPHHTPGVAGRPAALCPLSPPCSIWWRQQPLGLGGNLPPVPSARKALTRYQMLFRHMFYCKHVERQLCSVWISNKAAKRFSLHSAKWCVPLRSLLQSRASLSHPDFVRRSTP